MISVGDVLVELKRPVLRSPLRKITINIYPAGQINFCANICKTTTVKPRDDDIDFIFLSTAGPGFCIVTRNIGKAERVFKSLDMKTLVVNIYNGKYEMIERIRQR